MYTVSKKVGPMFDARVRLVRLEDENGHGISVHLEVGTENTMCEMLNEAYERGKEAGVSPVKPDMDDRSSMSEVWSPNTCEVTSRPLYKTTCAGLMNVEVNGPGVSVHFHSHQSLQNQVAVIERALAGAYQAGREDVAHRTPRKVTVDIRIDGLDGEQAALDFADAFRALVKKAMRQ